MRIAIFTDTYTPEINGVVSSIVTLQEGLEAMGHDVFIVTTHASILSISYENRVLRLPGIQLKQMYGYVLTSPLHIRAYNIVKEMDLDILHAHTEFGIGIFARIVARLMHKPLVVTYHTTYEDYTHYVNVFKSKTFEKVAKKTVSQLSKLYIETSDGAISPSEKTKLMLQGYGIKRVIKVIPTGLNLDRFKKENVNFNEVNHLRSELDLDGKLTILYVGRIAKEKSIDLVIEGFSKIDQDKIPSRLVIVGAGPQEDELKELANRITEKGTVLFLGKRAAHTIPIYYHACDIFVSASLTETQGMTFIEALASGKVVFAREDSVLLDLIVPGKNGYFFTDAIDFRNKIDEYNQLSQIGKDNIITNALLSSLPYDREVFINNVLNVYQNAITQAQESMLLKSVKHGNDVVECECGNKNRNLTILVSTEMFVELGLRKGNELSQETIEKLLEHEQAVKAYQSCIRKISVKDRSRKEIYDFLIENTTLDIGQINLLIEHLESRKYIDDEAYAKDMVTSLHALLQGKQKIIQTLRKKGISQEIIDRVIQTDTLENEVENALALAEKVKPNIKDKSVRLKKQKLTQKLMTQGFDFNVIELVMRSLNFTDDEKGELDVLRKAALKAKRKYASKFNGTGLRNAVFGYLDHQGFNLDDIYIILNEMEWDDE